MKVRVEFTIETADYGEAEFRLEIERLITDIDPVTHLLDFHMNEVGVEDDHCPNKCVCGEPCEGIRYHQGKHFYANHRHL